MTIVSGGQTGVDRAALDAAQAQGLPRGGWCPRGRRAEDGVIPACYPLRETDTDAYEARTEYNVRDSDATLVVTRGKPTGGTAFTVAMARQWNRPCRIIDLAAAVDLPATVRWLNRHGVTVLNVAGPRESTTPGIYAEACALLTALFSAAALDYPQCLR